MNNTSIAVYAMYEMNGYKRHEIISKHSRHELAERKSTELGTWTGVVYIDSSQKRGEIAKIDF